MSGQNQTAEPIAQAINLIRQGLWELAERVLGQLLSVRPFEPDGLQLMGLVRANQSRLSEAEALYRRSLALRPKQPNVMTNLGRLLAGTGRAEEGIVLLRAASRADPNNADTLLVLGQVQHGLGDFVFAEKNFRAALRLEPDNFTALLSFGALLNDVERPKEAETILRLAIELPSPPALRAAMEHNLGVALKMQRRYGEALTQFDAALARAPDLPRGEANRAGVLQHLGRNDDAVAGYRRALARDPGHLAAHQELNALLYRLGRDAEFLNSYDEAAARLPRPAVLLIGKGGFLARTGRFEEARACFERAASLEPENPAAQNGLALALAGLGQLEPAIAAYEKALALQPDDVPTQVNLAGTLLRAGDAARALTLTEDAVARQPLDQAALAMHELALRLNRDPRAAALADYERHVQVFDLDPPDGFTDMAAFNAALNAHLDALHGDAREHIDQTLRRGTQTMDPLFDGDNALVAALRARIEEAVAAYIARMDDDETHPLGSRRAEGFRFTGSWSSRLRDAGFHTNHIHPKGWISSCYHVAVPDAVDDEAERQGWIKFGEPPFDTALGQPIRRAIKPVPGRLVLFPSYMWHGTVPFRSAADRTTIAFDAIPV
ncbi:MAG: tetratricopeptide repeat protein [Rhizomicrobium sp.]